MENKLKIQFLYEVLETEISNENLKETAINDLNFIKERLEKLTKAIDLLKDEFNLSFYENHLSLELKFNYGEVIKGHKVLTKDQLELLKEVLEDE